MATATPHRTAPGTTTFQEEIVTSSAGLFGGFAQAILLLLLVPLGEELYRPALSKVVPAGTVDLAPPARALLGGPGWLPATAA